MNARYYGPKGIDAIRFGAELDYHRRRLTLILRFYKSVLYLCL